jgi:surface polysaccharide O-acyltransferase-like enzyme
MSIIGTWCYKILALFFNLQIGIYFELFSNNCGYFVLGYYLGTKGLRGEGSASDKIMAWQFSGRQMVLLGIGLVVLGTAGTAIASYVVNFSFVPGTEFNVFFYDYLTPNVGISAIGWFLVVRFGLHKRELLDVEKEFAAASFGIYFAHVLIMDWWGQCGYWHSGQHPFRGIPVLIGMVVSMTFMGILLLRCLPGGKKIT